MWRPRGGGGGGGGGGVWPGGARRDFFLSTCPRGQFAVCFPFLPPFSCCTLHSKNRRANFWYRSAIAGSDRIGSIQKCMAMNPSLEYFLNILLECFSFFKNHSSTASFAYPHRHFPKAATAASEDFLSFSKPHAESEWRRRGVIWSEKGFSQGKLEHHSRVTNIP